MEINYHFQTVLRSLQTSHQLRIYRNNLLIYALKNTTKCLYQRQKNGLIIGFIRTALLLAFTQILQKNKQTN